MIPEKEIREAVIILKRIITRWEDTQSIQKQNRKHYKLYKRTIDKSDKEIEGLKKCIALANAYLNVKGFPEEKNGGRGIC